MPYLVVATHRRSPRSVGLDRGHPLVCLRHRRLQFRSNHRTAVSTRSRNGFALEHYFVFISRHTVYQFSKLAPVWRFSEITENCRNWVAVPVALACLGGILLTSRRLEPHCSVRLPTSLSKRRLREPARMGFTAGNPVSDVPVERGRLTRSPVTATRLLVSASRLLVSATRMPPLPSLIQGYSIRNRPPIGKTRWSSDTALHRRDRHVGTSWVRDLFGWPSHASASPCRIHASRRCAARCLRVTVEWYWIRRSTLRRRSVGRYTSRRFN